MSFWGEMKQFYYVCKVGVHCTYFFKVFFLINGPQTAIDLNNGDTKKTDHSKHVITDEVSKR